MTLIHHLNCGTLKAPFIHVDSIVYCLLIETSSGLILVDTGFGTRDYSAPSLKMRFFLQYMGVPRLPEETAVAQVKALGYDVKDVQHIVQTHLHKTEYLAAMKPKGIMEFAYDKTHWDHDPIWVPHDKPVLDWFGFEAIPVITTVEAEILLIPLPGHTRGHCGVAIGKPGNWLLHCGDAASPFHKGADLHSRGESAYKLDFLSENFANYILGSHVPKLRRLLQNHSDQIQAISAHDIFSFQEASGAEE